jgi:transcriptional regulator with XRE-family HTH domain
LPKDTFATRLRLALNIAGKSQTELAEAINTSGSAVSQWLSGGKNPSRLSVEAASRFLGVDVGWLLGGVGPAPQSPGVSSAERTEYAEHSGWRFRPQPEDGGREYGNAGVWTFKPDIETFVRETLQNTLDAAREPVVQATFSVIRLQGQARDEFLQALQWDILRKHVTASAQSGQQLGQILREGLRMVDGHELILLRVSDSGTTGLVGPESGTGQFAALCRNSLDSDKQQKSSGGSFGLGKAALWRMSALSTVLFNSNPIEVEEGLPAYGRVIGRSDLGWHELGGDPNAGPGWFGRVNSGVPPIVSYRGNRSLAYDLYLDRSPDDIGTSIVVVGFYDPSREEPASAAEIVTGIEAAAARDFWPAISAGRLTVTVEEYDGRNRKSATNVDPGKSQPAFVDAFHKHLDDDVSTSLREPGDVARIPIQLDVPACTIQGNQHPAMTHQAVLLVRLAETDDASSLLRRAAFFRGSGMVVQYVDMSRVCLGPRPFHAALLCGTAYTSDAASSAAELFLRSAEPPAHDRWILTPALKIGYARGAGKALIELEERVRAQIRELVAPIFKDVSDGPQALKDLLRLSTAATPPPPVPRVTRVEGEVDSAGRWDLTATVRMPVKAGDGVVWRVEPVVLFGAETHGARAVPIDEIKATRNCKVKGGHIVIPAGKSSAEFRITTKKSEQPVPAEYVTALVDLRNATPLKEAEV